MNSLPKTVTRQRRDCDLNPGPTAPESSNNSATKPPFSWIRCFIFCRQLFILCYANTTVQVYVDPPPSDHSMTLPAGAAELCRRRTSRTSTLLSIDGTDRRTPYRYMDATLAAGQRHELSSSSSRYTIRYEMLF